MTTMTPEQKVAHVDTQTQLAKDSREAFSAMATSEPIVKYFAYDHLPERLRIISQPFGDLALFMCQSLPRSAERAAGLRKLLEAKDCAVRAALP